MIHIPVDVHLRKNKVPEAFPQSLRVIISRARIRQGQVALSATKQQEDDVSVEGARPYARRLHKSNMAAIFTVLLL